MIHDNKTPDSYTKNDVDGKAVCRLTLLHLTKD
jgi:hypothetical protein